MEKYKFGKERWSVLILFGLIGQISWAVENMYFNTFIFETVAPDLSAITLMVQLSGVVATVATLIAGTLSDKSGNRRSFICFGYLIWGITVAAFGFLSPELFSKLFSLEGERAVRVTLVAVIVGDCVMTLFGSVANDASFNAWVTDNTTSGIRGKIEGVISIFPLFAMLIVAGGFGILVKALGYSTLFLILGVLISGCGLLGIFMIKDSPSLSKNGRLRDILYGFKPSVVKANLPLYASLLVVLIYGVACQIFMPYLIIYMRAYLGFSTVEYSVVFALAILLGAAVNLYLTRISDRRDKTLFLCFATAIFSVGLLGMYFARGLGSVGTLVAFGIAGFVMICGYILISALAGSLVRDFTPVGDVGKLQGVRMVFSVLIPMTAGPLIGNAINKSMNVKLPNQDSPDAMTTEYIPAPEIFLAAALTALILFAVIPLIRCTAGKAKRHLN